MAFQNAIPKEIYSGTFSGGHVQGIAVDTERKYIYFSFTTKLVKTDLQGNFIGSVTGLAGHLGCIAHCKADGKIYGSLEYKRDKIGQGIAQSAGVASGGEDGFYVAVFEPEKINGAGLSPEGIMTAAFLPEVLKDYSEIDEADGLWHRYGCSGIDGISFGPSFGKANREILCVAYGVYGDAERSTNDHQVILAYEPESIRNAAKKLSQENPHKSGAVHSEKYFAYTGNTTYGIQNLEYDPQNREWLAAVYPGQKPDFPNYPMFVIDGTKAPVAKKLTGRKDETGLLLSLKRTSECKNGIYGLTYPEGQTGMYSFGNGYFYISYAGRTEEKLFFSNVKLCRRLPDDSVGFEIA